MAGTADRRVLRLWFWFWTTMKRGAWQARAHSQMIEHTHTHTFDDILYDRVQGNPNEQMRLTATSDSREVY
jgi:hypothetical protein